MVTNNSGSSEADAVVPEPKSGWNPFAPFKTERVAQPVHPVRGNSAALRTQLASAERGTDAERRRIARAWNGLQLPL